VGCATARVEYLRARFVEFEMQNRPQDAGPVTEGEGAPPSSLPRIVSVSGEALGEVHEGIPGTHADEHETKFGFDVGRLPGVLGRLRARCRPDPRHPEGIIRSIYYDDHRWTFVEEKRNSDFLKTKVRLRWYARVDSGEPLGTGFLEAKFKLGSCRRKLRLETDLAATTIARLPLDGPELATIPQLLAQEGSGFRGVLPGPLLPAFEIEYHRRRFVEPRSGARLSIDSSIRVSRVNARRMPPSREIAFPRAVLEVKGEFQELPPILRDLNPLGCRKEAFSKYGACFEWLDEAVL